MLMGHRVSRIWKVLPLSFCYKPERASMIPFQFYAATNRFGLRVDIDNYNLDYIRALDVWNYSDMPLLKANLLYSLKYDRYYQFHRIKTVIIEKMFINHISQFQYNISIEKFLMPFPNLEIIKIDMHKDFINQFMRNMRTWSQTQKIKEVYLATNVYDCYPTHLYICYITNNMEILDIKSCVVRLNNKNPNIKRRADSDIVEQLKQCENLLILRTYHATYERKKNNEPFIMTLKTKKMKYKETQMRRMGIY